MDESLFYINFEPNQDEKTFIDALRVKLKDDINPIYVLRNPIMDKGTEYEYNNGFALLIPQKKIMFFDFGDDANLFEEYTNDFIEDLGYIAKKYEFVRIVGRPRQWSERLVMKLGANEISLDLIDKIISEAAALDTTLQRICEILISLATGSINEAKRLGEGVPENILEQIKRRIILFDGEQTRFIFDEPKKKRITIQGLAGTGKTELLLHKIKELYIGSDNNKIVFTCHNEILADSLKKRVPAFFNFMKVEEQIEWEKRLWVMRSWGSRSNCNSGVYSYICSYYNIPFSRFSYNTTFDSICRIALRALNELENFDFCFDYVLIDESQDFSEGFLKLCEKVTKYCVYVAGDIFQDIFDNKSLSIVNPDFLLNRCYRTDPRTLMGAHAIGMGLFEQKLRWLTDEQWESCGYDIKRDAGKFELHRRPLKRFEEVDLEGVAGIKIVQTPDRNYINCILGIIDDIRDKNSTVDPDDIAIVFMENIDDNYKLAEQLQVIINEKYCWEVNIGYETKERKKGTLFISNRNNVKGLEFPFVICMLQEMLTNDFRVRNSIYMMLTRSFVTSYLVVPEVSEYAEDLIGGIDFVNKRGYIQISEPSDSEKEKLYNAIIKKDNVHKSQYEVVEDILDEMEIKSNYRKKLHAVVQAVCDKEVDREKLYDVIKTNYSMLES